MPPTRFVAAAALAALFAPAAPAQVFTDTFSTGTDAGWTRYSPLSNFGVSATYTFPGGNTYRITSAGNTVNAGLGPGRAGSYRADFTYTTNFFVAADVVNWNSGINQQFGLGGLLNNIGLGTTNGYLFLYNTATGGVEIDRVTAEGTTTLSGATGSVALTPGNSYRFTFQGTAGNFTAQVYNLATPTVPLVTVTNSAADTTYTSGNSGLLGFENTTGTTGSDVTFDNYLSAPTPVPEPSALALAALGLAGAGYRARRRGAAR